MTKESDELGPFTRLVAATAAHRVKFMRGPGIWRLLTRRRDAELAALIEAAIQAGVPFDAGAVEKLWGLGTPPGPVV